MESPFARYAPSDKKKINLPYAASLVGAAGAAGSNNPAVLAMQKVFGYGGGSVPFELQTFADQARNGELQDIPEGFSSIKTAATQVLDEASTFHLAMLTGLPPGEAMAVANQDLKQNLQLKVQPQPAQPAQTFGSPGGLTTAEATAADTGGLMTAAATDTEALMTAEATAAATKTVVNSTNVFDYFDADPNLNSVINDSLGSQVATGVEQEVQALITSDKKGPRPEKEDPADRYIHNLHDAAIEWTDLIWGDARGWLNTSITNVLEGLDISFPEDEAWWDNLTEEMQGRLIGEIERSVATFRAIPPARAPDETPDFMGVGPIGVDEAQAQLQAEFGLKSTPEMPPLSAYSGWIDEGIPLHKDIYKSLGLNSLPFDLRYMPHVKQALDLRFPTTLGAWYLGGLFEDQPSVEEFPGVVRVRTDVDRFVDFVLRDDSPFQVSLNPEDTRDMFKEFVLASRASKITYSEIAGKGGTYSSDFQERWELVNPWAKGYDIKTERAILKAQAGWTGIGERGRLRERALDNLQAIYARKRLIDPTYQEGFIAFASSIKGSAWYVED